jgi:DNA-binding transcriptional MerR regulator
MQLHGTSSAARQVPCAEATLRGMEARGLLKPQRDSAGRRLFTEDDIAAARRLINRKLARPSR